MSQRRHVVFFHQNYPAQFGPISRYLMRHHGINVTFLSEFLPHDPEPGIRHILYKSHEIQNQETAYFFTKQFERQARSMFGAHMAFMDKVTTPVDLLVGHVGFGNLMFFHVTHPNIPTVGFFEHFYDLHSAYRPEFPVPLPNYVRRPLNNATQILELEYCTRGYAPTPFQRNTYPAAYQHKLETIFDGIDTELYCPGEVGSHSLLQRTWPADAKIVSYVSRGLESSRGFDIFMEMAHRICQKRSDVHFVIAGREKTHYGSEMISLKDPSFKAYVMRQHNYDLNRFHFLDWIPEPALVDLFRLSRCQFYWTVPHTLSWSFIQAMATGCLMVGSDTEPVRDVLVHNQNGLMVDPNDIDAMVETVLEAVEEPERFNGLRQQAREDAVNHYSFEVCLPKLAAFYLSTIDLPRPAVHPDFVHIQDLLKTPVKAR